MDVMVLVAVLVTVFQGACVFGGMYCLLRAMRGIKEMADIHSKTVAWDRWFIHAKWLVGFLVLLSMCLLVSPSLRGGFVAVFAVACFMLFLGGLQLTLLLRRIDQMEQTSAVTAGQKNAQKIVVKKLQPNRLRGRDEEGAPVIFTEDDLKDFEEIRGVVSMINFSIALGYSTFKNCVPVMSFKGEEGQDFVLYQDDLVEAISG